MDTLTPIQEKALTIAQEVINTAIAIHTPWQVPIANARLLKKRPFPNRSIPHRVKRKLKAKAMAETTARVATTAMHAGLGIMNLSRAISTPARMFTGQYAPGGVIIPMSR